MRRNRNGYGGGYTPGRWGFQGSMNAQTINITNVTNVSQIVSAGHGGESFHGRKHKHGRGERSDGAASNRNPRLLRFCASGGLLDRDVAESMSNRELCDGFVEVGSYAVKGLGRTAKKWAGNMGHHARGLFGSLFRMVELSLS